MSESCRSQNNNKIRNLAIIEDRSAILFHPLRMFTLFYSFFLIVPSCEPSSGF